MRFAGLAGGVLIPAGASGGGGVSTVPDALAFWPCADAASPLVEEISEVSGRALATTAGTPVFRQAGPSALPAAEQYAVELTTDDVLQSGTGVGTWTGVGGAEWTLAFWARYDGSLNAASSVHDIAAQITGAVTIGIQKGPGAARPYTWLPGLSVPGPGGLAGTTTNGWQHYLLRWDGTTLALYLDGALAGSRVGGVSVGGSARAQLGGTAFLVTSQGWTGSVSHLAAWNRALTTDEIAALAAGTAIPGA